MADPLIVTRRFKAPRERVWAAWTRPEDFAAWFGTEAVEVPPATVSLDVRTGGAWSAEMHLPDGDTVHWFGEYTEVDPPHRLAFTMNDDPAAPPYPEPVVVEFREMDGGTEMRLTQPRGDFSDEEMEEMRASYQGFFDTMEKLLASRGADGGA
ncbi:SRPBCC family protein [Arthrobacter mobilis]|uniref:SRPBCC domain-containing protein n=1 Tax=Arthrobacter mobilis TaxID=2724944 RepID=A0A7X6HC84_9MICC|nr:SRPBCC domain-containing protein [Arthrobacter mobilis]NKX54448.1 SRPBCC domain-containing protein [Arthrobacter mobilis]